MKGKPGVICAHPESRLPTRMQAFAQTVPQALTNPASAPHSVLTVRPDMLRVESNLPPVANVRQEHILPEASPSVLLAVLGPSRQLPGSQIALFVQLALSPIHLRIVVYVWLAPPPSFRWTMQRAWL